MKSSKLESRVLCAFGSINLKDVDLSKVNIYTLSIMFSKYINVVDYYLIEHDDTETFHVHYLIKLNKQVRLSTLINYISNEMNINPLAINIDKCRGFSLCLRYMLHVDESSKLDNKKVYEIKNIVSNQNEDTIKNILWSDEDDECNWETLIKAVLKYSKTSELIKYLGLKNYHKYRFEIRDLLDEKLNSPKFQYEFEYLIEGETPF